MGPYSVLHPRGADRLLQWRGDMRKTTLVSLVGWLLVSNGCVTNEYEVPSWGDPDAGDRGDGGTTPSDGGPGPSSDSGPTPTPTPPPPADRDADGIPDDDEPTYGTNPDLEDTDGDGVGDGVELLAGTDPLDPASTIPETDFYVILPFEGDEQTGEIDFTARLGKADVFFLIDTTGSMGGSITNVQSTLSSVIVPALEAAISDLRMGVGQYRDFPIDFFGSPGDFPFALGTVLTDSVPTVQTALNLLVAGGGADGPESMTEALYETAAGACSTGAGAGQACFRPDANAMVVVVTDAQTHNGPGGSNGYTFAARTWDQAVSALTSIGARVLGAEVWAGATNLSALAEATGSRRLDGSLAVYAATGGAVDAAVAEGIIDLAGGIPQDVTSRLVDDPADAVDATGFIQAVTPLRATRTIGSMDATTFYGVPGGTTITFGVTFRNDFLPHGPSVQLFRATIDVVDTPAGTVLDSRQVYVVVPAEDGSVLY